LRVPSRKSRLIVFQVPLRIQRVVVGVGIVLALGASLRIDWARAQGRLEAHYTATLAGIRLGVGTWVVDIGPHQYLATANGRATGLLRMIGSGEGIAVARGSRVSYRLDEAASVRFTIQQPRSGRRVGKRCVAPTRRNRRRRRCTRYVTLSGSFSHAGRAGKNSFRFSGRLRGKALRPGSYRLSGVPTDAAGNRGQTFLASFTIAKPPRRRR